MLHPRGVLDAEVYKLIGQTYQHVQSCEPFVAGGKHLSEIVVIVDPKLGDNPGPSGLGTVRALQQLRQQFDITGPAADLKTYRLVIIPESTRIDADLQHQLRDYLRAGGALIVSGPAALNQTGQPVLAELGFQAHGLSPFSHVYLRHRGEIARGLPQFDTVMYERGFRMTAAPGAHTLCQVVEPCFERSYDRFCGHAYSPPDQLSNWAAIVQNERTITFAVPLLEAFGKHANVPYRQILGNCIDRLLPRPLIRDQGPTHLEATALGTEHSVVIHLLSFLPSRQTEGLDLVHDPFPLVDMPISIRTDQAPRRVTLQPRNEAVPYTYHDGYAHLRVTVLDGHQMLVLE